MSSSSLLSSSADRIRQLAGAEEGLDVVLQGNVAFAMGCARGGIHAADGYPGTPSTEVIHRVLRHLQDRMRVGWSVNEAVAVGLGFGYSMAGADVVITMKVPGLFQAADAVASSSFYHARRGALVLYIASDFTPSSTQYVVDPRYFLKSCFIPILEPRDHQEMLRAAPLAARLAREHRCPVAVLSSGILCHSEGLVRLGPRQEVPRLDLGLDFTRFMNLPRITRINYDRAVQERLPALLAAAESGGQSRIEWHDRSLGVVTHGVTELHLREVWDALPLRPSLLSLGQTFPLPRKMLRCFVEGLNAPPLVVGDGLRFVQEEMRSLGLPARGKDLLDTRTEWSPESLRSCLLAELEASGEHGSSGDHGRSLKLSGTRAKEPSAEGDGPDSSDRTLAVERPPGICAGCPYRAFGLVLSKLKKRKKVVASFGDIGCNSLLYFLEGIDTCLCMGAADSKRQGVVLADPSLAARTISVIGDSTECHSGLGSTRNAVFRNIPGVKVVLDNFTTAMTGGQPAPSSPVNLAGEPTRFDLKAALTAEGAEVHPVDAYDIEAVEAALRSALDRAADGRGLNVLLLRGACILELPRSLRLPSLKIDRELCRRCDRCLICPGLEKDPEGYPVFTHLCSGCGGQLAVCAQRCRFGAIVPVDGAARSSATSPRAGLLPPLPEQVSGELPRGPFEGLPPAIRVAVRGVGGQGNLFLGKVLAELALLAGYKNVVKGETHGMAQLGGAVISTFACGEVHSPLLLPGSADALVVLEESEVLRPGFLGLLKSRGVILLNRTRIIPPGLDPEAYPSTERILEQLRGRRVVHIDGLDLARSLGDQLGRSVNVIVLGRLATLAPFSTIPLPLWQESILRSSPTEPLQRANLAAFYAGRALGGGGRGPGG